MSAEGLGRRLLGEVEEATLDEVLRSLQGLNDPEPSSQLGILQIDRLLHLFQNSAIAPAQPQEHPIEADSTLPRRLPPAAKASKSGSKAPVVELTSISPGAGKTHLLYLITAIAILPALYSGIELQGKHSAAVVYDTDGRFDVARLAQIMKHYIITCAKQQHQHLADQDDAHIANLLHSSLTHLHILRPQSQSALLASLATLPAYLFNARAHHSTHRPLHALILDSASAFYWPVKAAEETSRLAQPQDQNGTENEEKLHPASSSPTASESYATLSRTLRKLQRQLSCTVIVTSTSMPYTHPNTSATLLPTLRPLLPPSWTLFPTLRLAVARAAVPPFAPGMSVEDAGRERRDRQGVVQRGVFGAWVDGWGADLWSGRVREGLRRVEGGGGFEFVIDGVEVAIRGREGEI
ncbi:hypothetical protein K490DRAFT_61674 [Saccharata proteae CBS 121410]|uniref:DNA recombination and repair protein Rad51-like C-terminal domain-containing protein n=1 Tax=Saccharata proteae CBS 121410 TaxID=1314787 RepID=A0A9P4M096_9PEZI|nr:hypothetical protein K490DRAFT_61674 [Saccharata proteae CBS 121410]